MTMSLVGPYLTTTNYKKRKAKKITDNQRLKLEQDWRAHNKQMRRNNCHSAQFDTFEQYLSYVRGEHTTRKKKASSFEAYVPRENPNYRSTAHIPSHGDGVGTAPKKEHPKYTGDLIVGIATMHKSNAVPVMRGTTQAKDISAMRR